MALLSFHPNCRDMLIILTEETITLTEVHSDALPLKAAKRAEKKSHLIQKVLYLSHA